MYNELVNSLSAMDANALGNTDCPEHFNRYQASQTSNINFKDASGYEFRTLIVGEIAGSAHGTVMHAIGNYYITPDVGGRLLVETCTEVVPFQAKPIDDATHGVKDMLALVVPTHATTRLLNFWSNQTVPLRSAIDVELGLEADAGEVSAAALHVTL
jgi:hypothetical protein